MINASKIARVPYTFRAQNITLSGVEVDSNLNASGYNVTSDYGFFSFLGSLVNRITSIFVRNIDVSNNLTVLGNLTAGNGALFVDANGSKIGVNTSDPNYTLDVLGSIYSSENFKWNLSSNSIYVGSPYPGSSYDASLIGNTVLGIRTAWGNTGGAIVAIGNQAAQNNTGTSSVFIGNDAGYNNSGTLSVSIGRYAGRDNLGDYFVGIGDQAGDSNDGAGVTVVGYHAGYNNSHNYLSALGYEAGYQNAGDAVTAFGYNHNMEKCSDLDYGVQ